jgi:hypothetical protein
MAHPANNDGSSTGKFGLSFFAAIGSLGLLINEKTHQKNRLDIRRCPHVEVACQTEMAGSRYCQETKAHRERNAAKGV